LYRRLANGPASQLGRENMPELFDSFKLHGPNGAHQCLVMELLGQSMTSLAERFSTNRLPGNIAWRVIQQVVQATAYVHRVGVVHGGLFDSTLLVIRSAKPACVRPTPR